MKTGSQFGIISTIKGAHNIIEDYVKYHIHLGFHKIYLFLDDPNESYPMLENHPEVKLIPVDEDLHQKWEKVNDYHFFKKFINADILARQALNVGVALDICKEDKIDWLLHIDCDELFHLPENLSLKAHFNELDQNGTSIFTYFNRESISDKVQIQNPFREIATFKKNPRELTHEELDKRKELSQKHSEKRSIHFMGYGNGKASCRVEDVKSGGAHYFNLKGKAKRFGPIKYRVIAKEKFPYRSYSLIKKEKPVATAPIILHFPNCGFDEFYNKYKNVHQSIPDTWLGMSKVADTTPFHIESRDLFQKGNKEEILNFYKKRICVEREIIDELITENLVVEISSPIHNI